MRLSQPIVNQLFLLNFANSFDAKPGLRKRQVALARDRLHEHLQVSVKVVFACHISSISIQSRLTPRMYQEGLLVSPSQSTQMLGAIDNANISTRVSQRPQSRKENAMDNLF